MKRLRSCTLTLFVIRRFLNQGNILTPIAPMTIHETVDKCKLDEPSESSDQVKERKWNVVQVLMEYEKKKKTCQQINENAWLFRRYLKLLSSSKDNTTVKLTMPVLEHLWKKFGDKDEIAYWTCDLTAEMMFSLGTLSRKTEYAVRRIVKRDDIFTMEHQLLRQSDELTKETLKYFLLNVYWRLISRATIGLSRLQLWNEIDDENYPSYEYTTCLLARMRTEIDNCVTLNYEHLVKFARNFGSIILSLSTMSVQPDDEILMLTRRFMENFNAVLSAEDHVTDFDTDSQSETDGADEIAKHVHQQYSYIHRPSHTSAGAYALFACANSMFNWKMHATNEVNKRLWNLWFRCCDEILMRAICYASTSGGGSYFDHVTCLNEIRLLTSMMVSANWFNNMNEFWELRDKVEELILLLAAKVSPKTASFLLLQMKTFENKTNTSPIVNRRSTFSGNVWTKLRERYEEGNETASLFAHFSRFLP